jgi:hypothetical protein
VLVLRLVPPLVAPLRDKGERHRNQHHHPTMKPPAAIMKSCIFVALVLGKWSTAHASARGGLHENDARFEAALSAKSISAVANARHVKPHGLVVLNWTMRSTICWAMASLAVLASVGAIPRLMRVCGVIREPSYGLRVIGQGFGVHPVALAAQFRLMPEPR